MDSNQVDQKKLFNKLKHDLESWRELILLGNSLLKWEKKFFPAIIFGIISIFYIILWYLDLSPLTLISLGLLNFTIVDYVFPIVSKLVFKSENWSGTQENKFEEVCTEICTTKIKLCSYYNYLFTAKEERSTVFMVTISIALLFLAWIGSIIDNMLLSYIACLAIAFYPGLNENGVIGHIKTKFGSVISANIKQLKEKTSKKAD